MAVKSNNKGYGALDNIIAKDILLSDAKDKVSPEEVAAMCDHMPDLSAEAVLLGCSLSIIHTRSCDEHGCALAIRFALYP